MSAANEAFRELGYACRTIDQTVRSVAVGGLAFAAAALTALARASLAPSERATVAASCAFVGIAIVLIFLRQRAQYHYYRSRIHEIERTLGIQVYTPRQDDPEWNAAFDSNEPSVLR